MNGDRSYTGAAGKMETEGAKTSISPHGQKRQRSFVEDGLVLAVIGRRALVDRLGVGGGRIQPG